MRVKEWQGDVVFLHEVMPGSADRSYGIQVAKLAGLPMPVIERARLVLTKLEAEDRGSQSRAMMDDLPLFAITARETPQAPSVSDELSAALAAINPDDLTPREALEALYALKTKATRKN